MFSWIQYINNRTCHELNMIYIIVRTLNEQNPHDRVKMMFNSPLFDRMKIENPGYANQVQVISGEILRKNLGITEIDYIKLKYKVNIIIHLAGITTHNNCNLRSAIFTNIRATNDLVSLAKGFTDLKAFIHISSVFAHHALVNIHEQFYSFPIPINTMIQMAETIPDHIMNGLAKELVSEWPDVVTYTKAASEKIIQSAGRDFPACIIRPGFVLGTANEPIAGWTNHTNNLIVYTLGSGLGLVRTFHGSLVNANIIPVDMLVNLILVACWDMIGSKSLDFINEELPCDITETPIYNFVLSNHKCCSWKQLGEYFFMSEKRVSSFNSYFRIPFCYIAETMGLYRTVSFIFHTLPAKVVDIYFTMSGKEPRLSKFYEGVHKSAEHLNLYQQMRIRCYNHNVYRLMNKLSPRDRALFCFDISTLSWNDYFDKYVKGLRVYLMGNRLQMATSTNTINSSHRTDFFQRYVKRSQIVSSRRHYPQKLKKFIENCMDQHNFFMRNNIYNNPFYIQDINKELANHVAFGIIHQFFKIKHYLKICIEAFFFL
ncbi:fatty acyl-CoA reductase wat-like isoform X3 [Daktulosphaira vitifoliae]|uniref:fatty acyl-CoA reductase wat-like isoform X3 n=1 Tax=Daktulosphaira vitifoliae TaxID=58002 RepID=UPI0021AADE80|nr:fatty acyl-CoA reductase wat-like isoform X3 [Daktulosphaira vitifoliae]